MIGLGMWAILALIVGTKIATSPRGAVPATISAFKRAWNGAIEPHRAVLKVLCYVFIVVFFIGNASGWAGDYIDFPALSTFGGYCKLSCWFTGGGILLVLAAGAQEQEKIRLRDGMAALFAPRT